MISIVISSYKEHLYIEFIENIKSTIGCDIPYEIIKVNNPNLFGICEAYNKGATQAKYPYIVFAHEDIRFLTNDWGTIIEDVFKKDEKIGLVGCAGGIYKSYFNTGWALAPNFISRYMVGTHDGKSHLCKTFKGVNRIIELSNYKNLPAEFLEEEIKNEEVLVLDGMFLVTKKSIHLQTPFDQTTFQGFHCYDLDYSLQINRNYKVVVNHNILIEHFSTGTFNKTWFDEMEKLRTKWKSQLPASSIPMTKSEKKRAELHSIEVLIWTTNKNKLPLFGALKPIYKKEYIGKIGVQNWIILILSLIFNIGFLMTRKYAKKIFVRSPFFLFSSSAKTSPKGTTEFK